MAISGIFYIFLSVLVITGILRKGRGETLTGKPQILKILSLLICQAYRPLYSDRSCFSRPKTD